MGCSRARTAGEWSLKWLQSLCSTASCQRNDLLLEIVVLHECQVRCGANQEPGGDWEACSRQLTQVGSFAAGCGKRGFRRMERKNKLIHQRPPHVYHIAQSLVRLLFTARLHSKRSWSFHVRKR